MPSCHLPDNVCVCLSLKKGGKVIAGISILTSLAACTLLIIYFCSDFDDLEREIGDNSSEMVEKLNQNKSSAQLSAGLFLLLSFALLATSILLIKGINNKNQRQIAPFLTVLGITIVLAGILSIVHFHTGSFFAVLTFAMIFIYFFICIYSLYKSFDDAALTHRDVEATESY